MWRPSAVAVVLLLAGSTLGLVPTGQQITHTMALKAGRLPTLEPMPEVIRSNVSGTWAYDTMSRRIIQDILDKVVLTDNDCSQWPGVKALRDELLQDSILRPLEDDAAATDVAEWNQLLALHANQSWLSAPWMVAEFYLYRRLAEATHYFDNRLDIFATAKRKGLEAALPTFRDMYRRSAQLIADGDATELFVSIALWGNRMDLSLWPGGENVASQQGAFQTVLDQGKSMLLADDSAQLLGYVSSLSLGIVDIVVDNAGFELLTDLLLADHLCRIGKAKEIRLRVKHHPTFVSDVIVDDVQSHIDAVSEYVDEELGNRWRQYVASGTWSCHEDGGYWSMPYALWEMPEQVYASLAEGELTVVKGDANYRRALGDRSWAYDAPFSEVCAYFPVATVCLRTLKAEVGCGMEKRKCEAAQKQDAAWLTNGKYGVVHFAAGNCKGGPVRVMRAPPK